MSTSSRKDLRDDGFCGLVFLKYALCIFNIIFWLCGCVVLGVGIWTLVAKHQYIALLSTSIYPATTYVVIITGAVAILVGIIGCYGAIWENRCCLMTYAFFLLLIFLLEAIAGILAYTYEGALRQELSRSLNRTMLENYYYDIRITNATDDMHVNFKCCGADSFEDWKYSKWLKTERTNNTVPDSCCKTESPGCAVSNHPSNINYKGCMVVLQSYLHEHLMIIGAVGIGICLLQIFGIIFACCLARRIREWEDRKLLDPVYM